MPPLRKPARPFGYFLPFRSRPHYGRHALGAYPSPEVGPLLDSHKHDIAAILREAVAAEAQALRLYRDLLATIDGHSVALAEFARQMIFTEEVHASDVDKMLRRPGDFAAAVSPA